MDKKEKERILFELRAKRNQVINFLFSILFLNNFSKKARKINKDEVLAETIGEKTGRIEGHEEYVEQRREREKEAAEIVQPEVLRANKEKERLRNTTALDMDDERRKKEKRDRKSNFAWDIHNNESKYKSHKKRLATLEKMTDLSEDYKQKKAKGNEVLVKDVDDMGFLEVPEPTEERLDLLVKELKAKDASKKNFSRRRADYEDKDVSSINSKNKKFVTRLERAFGEYSAETKASLERGTAL